MKDAQRYRGYAVDCLLAAKTRQFGYLNILVSIGATWHALARQDEAMDLLLASWSAPKHPSAPITPAAPWNLVARTVPHYINEDKSDMRGIKSGWYAVDEDGNLVFGPFDTYEECVEREVQPTYFMLSRPISNSAALGR